MTHLDRRTFLRGAAATTLGAAIGCGGDDYEDDPEIVAADAQRLTERIEAERRRAGHGPRGELRFRGYRGLAELPEFEVGDDGEVRLAADDVPRGIDIHAHLGIALLLAPRIDQLQRTPRVEYFLDCDAPDAPCDLDLDIYINDNFSEAMMDRLQREQIRQLVLGSHAAATHTAANLVAELDRVGFDRAAILPIKPGLPFGDDLTGDWIDQVGGTPLAERLVLGASVHPRDGGWRAELEQAVAGGARILKLHPEAQRFYPDDPAAKEVYAACQELDLPVIFHAGRSGIEPESVRKYALMRRYVGAVADFPKVRFVFGHGGARDVSDAIRIARAHSNVWLGSSSLGISTLGDAIHRLGPERVAFGSDWPFYAIAAPLAKVLILTRNDPKGRQAILRDNALRILGEDV